MAVLLDGFDNAGKSTLAEKLKFPVMHAGGPPKNEAHLKECLSSQLTNCIPRVTFDRVSCISNQVYGNRMFDAMHMNYLHAMLDRPKTVLVYCRPPIEILTDFSKHIPKNHDTAEHLEDIEANMALYIERYDLLMSTLVHINYDYTIYGDDVEFINGLIYSQVKA